MTVETETLMMEILRRIQADVTAVKGDMRELKTRMGHVESKLSLLDVQISEISVRMDRRDDVIERVLQRLELSEKPVS
jgi:predicted  nucleic acid-binding Zn-ribbon protein